MKILPSHFSLCNSNCSFFFIRLWRNGDLSSQKTHGVNQEILRVVYTLAIRNGILRTLGGKRHTSSLTFPHRVFSWRWKGKGKVRTYLMRLNWSGLGNWYHLVTWDACTIYISQSTYLQIVITMGDATIKLLIFTPYCVFSK